MCLCAKTTLSWVSSRLSQGSPGVRRKADRVTAELRGAGRYRDREHPAAKRIAPTDGRLCKSLEYQTATAETPGGSSIPRLQTFSRCSIPSSRQRRGSAARPLKWLQCAARTPSASLQQSASRKNRENAATAANIRALHHGGRTMLTRQIIQIEDLAEQSYLQSAGGCHRVGRTALGIPLLGREQRSALSSTATTYRPFTKRQIAPAPELRGPGGDRHGERPLARAS